MPGYEDYGRFLVERLKPLIDGKYRTLTGPTNTAAMGSSLGGVASSLSRLAVAKGLWESRLSFEHIHVTGAICSTAFPRKQSEKFGFIWTAAGPATTTKQRAACETA